MAELHKSYQLAHDIDWFFQYNSHVFHCASNCSQIPHKFADSKDLRLAQEIVASLPDILVEEDIIINEQYELLYIVPQLERLREIFGNNPPMSPEELREIHLSSFKKMAKKGLWSFDHAIDMEENQYILVACPRENVDNIQLLRWPHPLQHGVELMNVIPNHNPVKKLESNRLQIYS